MSQEVTNGNKTFTAGAALAQFLRVKLSSSKLAASGLADGDADLGTIQEAAFADLDIRAVRLINDIGTRKMVASEAISVGSVVYTAAGGKVSDTAATGAAKVGIALEASTADGDIIEILTRAF